MFMIRCLDKANSLDLRLQTRAAHLEWLMSVQDKIVICGPLLSDDGQSMIGSLLLMDFPDRETAEDALQHDPYAKAGLFQSVEIMRWRQVLPK